MRTCCWLAEVLVPALAAAAIVAGSSPAHAEDIPIITLTEAGPDRDIPIGSSFYLAGSAKDASKVQAIVLRKGSNAIFGGAGESCREVIASLGNQFRGSDNKASRRLRDLEPGVTSASAIWLGKNGKAPDHQALVTVPWERKDPGQSEFKVLVPSDDSFFTAGFGYCVLVYANREQTRADDRLVTALVDLVERVSRECEAGREQAQEACEAEMNKRVSCDARGDEASQRACQREQRIKCEASAATEYESCHANASQVFEQKVAEVLQPVDATTQIKADEEIRDAFDAAFQIWNMPERIRRIFESWSPVQGAPGGVARRVALAAYLDAQTDALAKGIVGLLALHDKLHPLIDPRTRAVNAYFTRDGKMEIRMLGFVDGLARLRVAQDERGADNRTLDVTTSALTLPGVEAITLRDLVELGQGRVRLGDEYLEVQAYYDRLAPSLAARDTLPGPDRIRLLASARAHMTALARAVELLLAASTTTAPVEGTAASVHAWLGRWLRSDVLVPCNQDQQRAWGVLTQDPKSGCGTTGKGWPGYLDSTGGPLAYLAHALDEYERALPQWIERRPTLTEITTWTLPVTAPMGTEIEFTRETWFFSYVTPVVGYATYLSSREPFTIPYLALQIHLVPNPANEPLWTNGGDWKRGFALELGFTPGAGDFGQDNRFRGIEGIAPVYAGLTVHLIPYTGLTVGGALVERRASPIAAEEHELFPSLYIGLNVDINVPELVRSARSRRTQASLIQ